MAVNKTTSVAVNRRVVGSSPTGGATRFHIELRALPHNDLAAHFPRKTVKLADLRLYHIPPGDPLLKFECDVLLRITSID
jgi:hypothetical protein